MSETEQLGCQCGQTTWQLAPISGSKLICYCADCQTFARHLEADTRLDEQGGTTIFQTTPKCLHFTAGQDNVAVLRLGPKGLFRWYARCCNTPIGNTLGTPKFSFVGVILPTGYAGLGPVRAQVNTDAASSPVTKSGMLPVVASMMGRALRARLTGSWRSTPFFDAEGTPLSEPHFLSPEQRASARPA